MISVTMFVVIDMTINFGDGITEGDDEDNKTVIGVIMMVVMMRIRIRLK